MKLVRLFRNSYELKFWDVLNRNPEKYKEIIDNLENNCETTFMGGRSGIEIRMYDFDPMIGALKQDEIFEIADFRLVE